MPLTKKSNFCRLCLALVIFFAAGCKKNTETNELKIFVTESQNGLVKLEEIYTYDLNKVLKSRRVEDNWNVNGKLISEFKYYYNSQGYMDSILTKQQSQPGSNFYYVAYKYHYDAANAPLYQVQSSKNTNTGKFEVVDSLYYVTDAAKRVTCMKRYTSFILPRFLSDSITYSYDARGNMVLLQSYNRNRESDPFLIRYKLENQYDDKSPPLYPQKGGFLYYSYASDYPFVNNIINQTQTGYANPPPAINWISGYTATVSFDAQNRPVKVVKDFGPNFSTLETEYSYR
ncbi:MAG: hypothetical protein JNK27_11015 [Chitinophagaceae bacterium]|nr:hypothetical protein [Chitinophagaceae bacterium]